jgi:hypothetical protein
VPTALRKFWDNLPPPVATALAHVGSLAAGMLAAFVIHYVLYRIGLPSSPFIYVAF